MIFLIDFGSSDITPPPPLLPSSNPLPSKMTVEQELRELTKLKDDGHDASFVVRKEELDLGMTDSSILELRGPSGRPKTRLDKLLRDSATSGDNASSGERDGSCPSSLFLPVGLVSRLAPLLITPPPPPVISNMRQTRLSEWSLDS
jgi:hypothetical protein